MVWPLATASSISLTELSRATASGMNACGNSTVSRNGSTGISGGTRNEAVSDPVGSKVSFGLLTMCAPPGRGSARVSRRRDPQAPPPAEPVFRTPGLLPAHVEAESGRTATSLNALALLRHLARLFAILATDGEGQRAQP